MLERAAPTPGRAILLGARPLPAGRAAFRVWAPRPARVDLELETTPLAGSRRVVPMTRDAGGSWSAEVDDAPPGTRYSLLLDGRTRRPDPASRSQPEGVHGPSELLDLGYPWTDAGWRGPRLGDLAIYELHVGTFTPEGTFDAAAARLPALRDLGVTAIELMPVAAFPGARNWGYDGVAPFAVHAAYGGARGLQRLVDAAHAHELAVVLDVVDNHLGPEGNYLADFGPYFTDQHRTPWGSAINFDGPGSDEVRAYFVANALQWVRDCHVDALRLDAVHAIHDETADPFLAELRRAVAAEADALGRRIHLIAESDRNDPRLVQDPALGGLGLDAVWSDDFHHALHALLTGERHRYYADFGRVQDLARAIREGFVRAGQRSVSFGRRHGLDSRAVPGERLVVCAQNHDQIGNRARGERLGSLVPFEALKVAAGLVLLAPMVPLLFMGEEYGETAPFLYFTSHGDEALIEAVRRGRRAEFPQEGQAVEARDVPDPQDPRTFEASRLDWSLREKGGHAGLLGWYRELLRLRREPPFEGLAKDQVETASSEPERLLVVCRAPEGEPAAVVLARLGAPAPDPAVARELAVAWPPGVFDKVLDSSDERWGGPGSALPYRLESTGEARLVLPSHALVVYRASQEPP